MSFVGEQHSAVGNGIVLVPPQLPPFLARVFDLSPISGSPSTEGVKLVHGAIRTLNSLLHTPELRDSNLPMELSQHLFDIQMVRYREKYAVGIFPNDIVYTPPSLPEHIPAMLEPVVGPPSDDELRSAHAALRISESFANVASVFDADLSMQLSQHIFDLQLARNIRRSTQTQLLTCQAHPARSSTRAGTHPNTTTEIRGEGPGNRLTETPQEVIIAEIGPDEIQHPGILQGGELPVAAEREQKNEQQEANKLLVEIRETLKNVNRTLVGAQNSLARGFNSSQCGGVGLNNLGAHSLINDNGETPQMHGLPTLYDRSNISGSIHPDKLSMNVLARYLQFYGIGSEMIDDGEELTIKAGMENEAKRMLKHCVYANEG